MKNLILPALAAMTLSGCWIDQYLPPATVPQAEAPAAPPAEGAVAEAPTIRDEPAPVEGEAYAPADIFVKSLVMPPKGEMHLVFFEHPVGKTWCSRVEVRQGWGGIHLTMMKQAMPAEGRLPESEANFTHDPKTLEARFHFPNPENLPVYLDGPGGTRRIWPVEAEGK